MPRTTARSIARQVSPAWLAFAFMLTTLANTVLDGLPAVILAGTAVVLVALNLANAYRRARRS